MTPVDVLKEFHAIPWPHRQKPPLLRLVRLHRQMSDGFAVSEFQAGSVSWRTMEFGDIADECGQME